MGVDTTMKKLLFVALHRPNRSPSQRYRFEQYMPFLKEKGFKVKRVGG